MNGDPTSLDLRLLTLLHQSRGERDEAARAELNALLRGNAEARRLLPRLLVDEQALVSQLRDEGIAALIAPPAASPGKAPGRGAGRWVAWRPLTAAAAGIVLGMLCTSVVFGYVGPRAVERVRAVFREGFESGVDTTLRGIPCQPGSWGGDEAEAVKSAPGVKAHGGSRMLRFLRATHPGENSPRSQWGDVYRLVDVHGLAGAGRAVARVSARFAQGQAAVGARFSCSVEAMALDQDASRMPSRLELAWLTRNSSASGSRKMILPPAGGWKQISVEVPVTSETRYVMLHLAVIQEQPVPESGAVRFPGHCMDDVTVEIVTTR